jgi:hypothetical protein
MSAVIHDTSEEEAKAFYERLYHSVSPNPFIHLNELPKLIESGKRFYKPCYLCNVTEDTRKKIEALWPDNY